MPGFTGGGAGSVQIIISAKNETAGAINGATNSLRQLGTTATSTGRNASSMGNAMSAAAIKQQKLFESATQTMRGITPAMQNVAKNMTQGLTPAMMGIPTEKLQKMGIEAGKTPGIFSRMGSAASSAFNQMGIGAAIAGGAILAFLGAAVAATGKYEDEWSRFSVVLTGSALNMKATVASWGPMVNQIQDETGRAANVVIGIMDKLVVSNIKNKDVMKASVESITAGAFATGSSVDATTTSFQRSVMTGALMARNLKTLGLTLNDVGMSAAEFKTKTEEERAAVLNSAMAKKFGSEANNAYKNSYEGMMDKVSRLWDELLRSVGETLLPTIIGAMQVITPIVEGVINLFKSLPSPIRIATVMFVALVGVVLTLVGTMNMLGFPLPMVTSRLLGTGAAAGVAGAEANAGAGGFRALAASMWATIGVAGAVGIALAAVGVAAIYLASQDISASNAMAKADADQTDRISTLNSNKKMLEDRITSLNTKRAQEVKAGQSTAATDRDLTQAKKDLAAATQGVTDATDTENKAHAVAQGLKDLQKSRVTEAQVRGGKAAATAEGQSPEEVKKVTSGTQEYNTALEKQATLSNNISSGWIGYANNMERVNTGTDAQSKVLRGNKGLMTDYANTTLDGAKASQRFFEAMDKGDIWGVITNGLQSTGDDIKAWADTTAADIIRWGESTQNAFSTPFTLAYVAVVNFGQKLRQELIGFAGFIQPVVDAYNNLGPSFGNIVPSITNGLNMIRDAFKPIICAIWGCSPGIISGLQWIASQAGAAWSGFLSAIKPVTDALKPITDAITNIMNLKMPTIGNPLAGLKLPSIKLPSLGDIATTFRIAMKKGEDAVKKGLDDVNKLFHGLPSKILTSLTQLGAHMRTAFVSAFSRARAAVMNGINQIAAFFRTLPGRAVGALGALAGMIGGVLQGAWNYGYGIVMGGVNRVVSFIQGLPGRAMSALSGIYNAVTAPIRSAMDTAWSIVSTAVNKIMDIWNTLSSTAGSAWQKVSDTVKPVIQGIVNIINTLKSAIGMAAGSPELALGPSFWGVPQADTSMTGPLTPAQQLVLPAIDPEIRAKLIATLYAGPGPSGAGAAGPVPNELMDFLLCDTCGYAGPLDPNVGQWVKWIEDGANRMGQGFMSSHGMPKIDFGNPKAGMAAAFYAFATNLFKGFSYQFYYNALKGPAATLSSHSGNCADMSELLIAIANAFGLSGSIVHGTWNGIGHEWANISGIGEMDPTALVKRGSWTGRPSAGPAPNNYNNREIHLHFHAPVYGMSDFNKTVEGTVNDIFNKAQ